jgi:hypothetical protein
MHMKFPALLISALLILTQANLFSGPDDDLDFDGLIGSQETFYGTDELDADSDDDGISDGEEVSLGLFPDDSDSDNDFLSDGLELGRDTPIPGGSGYAGTAPFWQPDLDTSTTTDPLDSDTDNDGVVDGQEDFSNDGRVDLRETSPTDADSDDDGLNDREYIEYGGVFPNDPDTDDDGLTDGLEAGKTTGISGGISDGGFAVPYVGTDPSWVGDADPSTTTDPLLPDTDGDGLCDGAITLSGYRGHEDANGNGQVDAGETDPNVLDPYLNITRTGDELTVEYVGTLQESTLLSGWTDSNPQPNSPFTFTLSSGEKQFYQIKPAVEAQSLTIESQEMLIKQKKGKPSKADKAQAK